MARRRGLRTAAAAGAIVGAVLALPTSAGADVALPAPAWLAPDTLTPPGSGSGLAPRVAVAADGGAVAVWQERMQTTTGQPCTVVCVGGVTLRVRAAVRPAGGAWSAPETLAEEALAGPPGVDPPPGPRVAVDPSGAAVAVWEDSAGGLGNVAAAVRPADGPWGPAEDISGTALVGGTPSVVVDANGNALAVWEQEDGGDFVIHGAIRPAGGDWGVPEGLSAPVSDASGPQATLDGAGNALVAWTRSDGFDVRAEAVIRPAGGPWGIPEAISPSGASVAGLRADLAPDGGAIVAWVAGGSIEAVLRPPAGPWGEPETVVPAAGATTVGSPRVALAPDGTAVVAWQRGQAQVLEDTSDFSVWAAVRPPAGPWDVAVRLSPDGPGGGTDPDLTVDGAGNAVVAWHAAVRGSDRIQATGRAALGAWALPTEVSATGRDARDVDLDADASGKVTAVWERGNGIDQPVRVEAATGVVGGLTGAPGAPRCRPLPPSPAGADGGGGAPIELSAPQLRINQRISQAGIRRLNAVIAWLDAGIQGRDLCGGAFGSPSFAPQIATRRAATAGAEPRLPDPRPIALAEPGQGRGTPTLSARQLLINQRISQAVVRRANAIEARLAGRLTGGDVAAGTLGQAELGPLLRVMEAAATSPEPAPSRTAIAPRKPGPPGTVQLTAKQLRINQRISQAGVRRANALIARLEAGLTGEAFADGTITARNLAPELTAP